MVSCHLMLLHLTRWAFKEYLTKKEQTKLSWCAKFRFFFLTFFTLSRTLELTLSVEDTGCDETYEEAQRHDTQ